MNSRYIEVKKCEDCPYRREMLQSQVCSGINYKPIQRKVCSLEDYIVFIDRPEVYDEGEAFPKFCRLLVCSNKLEVENA